MHIALGFLRQAAIIAGSIYIFVVCGSMPGKMFDSNFFVRTASAIAMLAVFLGVVIKGGLVFSIAVLFVASVSIFEWHNITAQHGALNSHTSRLLWNLLGLAIILASCIAMLCLGYENDKRPIILLCGAIWSTDIFAYIVGRSMGGAKLAPSISPGKTVFGSIGGLVGAAAFGLIFSGLSYSFSRIPGTVGTALVISLLAQVSDLLESAFKRKFGVKNSGIIIPGHGGILDRIDSFLLPLPFMLINLALF